MKLFIANREEENKNIRTPTLEKITITINKTKDTISLKIVSKIFRKNKDNNVVYLETRDSNKTPERIEYQKKSKF
jgi:hypothetical protein